MSSIYIQEPSTNGKVILKTTLGDIDIELWSREAPKACRNFIQLCLEGYYDNTIFHRVIKGFLAQGGDPTGTGYGGDSIYGEGFKDEFHSRLRFVRRGLLAMANAEKNANGSQFFFTLGPCPHLQDKHTIFGKVVGKTLYNMIKFDDLQVDQNEKPLYPPKIISTEIILNPFDDIVPRKIETKKTNEKEERPKVKGTKDFKLLSFGDEAEEEEEEISEIITKFKGKSKSSHDLLNDPKLSSVPAIEPSLALNQRLKGDIADKMEEDGSDSDDEIKKNSKLNKLKKIKDKFKNSSFGEGNSTDKSTRDPYGEGTSKDFNSNEEKIEEDEMNPGSKLDKIKNEFKLLKKQMKEQIKKKTTTENPFFSNDQPEAVIEFKKEIDQFKALKYKDKKKRAEKNLSIFEKFQAKISNIEGDSNDGTLSDLFKHKLVSEESDPVLAKDANIRKEAEWFDIYDPRNPVNKRRREADKERESKSSKKVHRSK